jgi:hypothetical protein
MKNATASIDSWAVAVQTDAGPFEPDTLGKVRRPCRPMTIDAALTLAENLSPQSQLHALRTFRENSARFDDVRSAFVAAIEAELAAKVVEVEQEIERRERRPSAEVESLDDDRRIDWAGVLAIAFMAASAFITGAGLFAVARTLWLC